MPKKKTTRKTVKTLTHGAAKRKNIPTVEHQPVMEKNGAAPIRMAYQRRNLELDPQLVWRGKDAQDAVDLTVHAPPLYIQEKVKPQVLVADLMHHSKINGASDQHPDLFADFNGLPSPEAKTEFYQHDANWSNRMIVGDSLQVMASLAEREGLRGKVQCVYLDPPYGINFNSNFQWSATSRTQDSKGNHISREPEQIKAFRDTWRDGIHSYLSYLRDRFTVVRDLLSDSGSIFVQISDENVHRVRALMDEVFGEGNFVNQIGFRTCMTKPTKKLNNVFDYILWYAKDKQYLKFRELFLERESSSEDEDFIGTSALFSSAMQTRYTFEFNGEVYAPQKGWRVSENSLKKLAEAGRLHASGTLRFKNYASDFSCVQLDNIWSTMMSEQNKIYVVQTSSTPSQRCILMTTDPGDLVLDPTCGSGTTAYVAEQWGRRWITVDTSRVAMAVARARIMGASYPYYLLSDSADGQQREAKITGKISGQEPTHHDVSHGFVYKRVPHVTLKSIANNADIDVIYATHQEKLEPLRAQLNKALKQTWAEYQIPHKAEAAWPPAAKKLHADYCKQRIARQQEIDASIAAKADVEYLYDQPYQDKKKVRVAGPFTVESISPHRMLAVDENEELIDSVKDAGAGETQDFVSMILEGLKTSGVQQVHKENRITFSSLSGWPGENICAEGHYTERHKESARTKRAGIFIGPEFGTVSRPDLVAAARESAEAGFDVLIACAFNYDAHSSELEKLGRIPILKARMNADLHMAGELKNTGKGNLFVIFGEPDIKLSEDEAGNIIVQICGVDVFHPQSGEVRSDGTDGIVCWFLDTDYNEESFFVRHAYFLGDHGRYQGLKRSLKSEINEAAWATLNSDTSRPFPKPASGRFAVKVINHLGDEVMKVFKVGNKS